MRFLAVFLVFLSVLPARAQWTRVDSNLPLVGNYAGSVLAVEGGTLVTMALQGPPYRLRAYRSTNDGGSWTEATTFGAYIAPPNFLVSLGGRLAAGSLTADGSAAVFTYSDDRGDTWSQVLAPGIPSPKGMDRIGNTYFVTTAIQVARSTDAGQTWALLPGSPSSVGVLTTSQAVFVVGTIGQLYRSLDLGVTWTQLPVAPPLNLAQGLWKVGDRLYAKVVAGDLAVSDDHGTTWSTQSVFDRNAFLTTAVSPDGSTWFPYTFGASSSFYLSNDRAQNATSVMTGYPISLLAQPCLGFPVVTSTSLVVATQCFNALTGIWALRYGPVTSVERNDVPGTWQMGAPWPNPAADAALIDVRLDQPGSVDWTLVDALGRVVGSGGEPFPAAGLETIRVDLGNVAPGLYQLRVSALGQAQTRPLAVVR